MVLFLVRLLKFVWWKGCFFWVMVCICLMYLCMVWWVLFWEVVERKLVFLLVMFFVQLWEVVWQIECLIRCIVCGECWDRCCVSVLVVFSSFFVGVSLLIRFSVRVWCGFSSCFFRYSFRVLVMFRLCVSIWVLLFFGIRLMSIFGWLRKCFIWLFLVIRCRLQVSVSLQLLFRVRLLIVVMNILFMWCMCVVILWNRFMLVMFVSRVCCSSFFVLGKWCRRFLFFSSRCVSQVGMEKVMGVMVCLILLMLKWVRKILFVVLERMMVLMFWCCLRLFSRLVSFCIIVVVRKFVGGLLSRICRMCFCCFMCRCCGVRVIVVFLLDNECYIKIII